MAKKGKAKPRRCQVCGAYLPRKFIFLPNQVPDKIQFPCSKCGAVYELQIKEADR